MSWEDRLQKASWRGVGFYQEDRTLSGGRRGETHQFADREEPKGQDLGRKFETRQVTAYIIGDDYDQARDRLIEALRRPGSGVYVDPYGGSHKVNARIWSLKETQKSGGVALFNITFEEAGEDIYPFSDASGVRAVDDAAGSLVSSAISAFADRFSVKGVPNYVEISAQNMVEDFADVATGLKEVFPVVEQPLYEGLSAGLVEGGFVERVEGLSNLGLISKPGDLASEVSAVIGELGVPESPIEAVKAYEGYMSLASFGVNYSEVPVLAASRLVERANQSAFVSLVRQAAIANAVRCASRMALDSYDKANAVRHVLSGEISQIMNQAGAPVAGEPFDDVGFAVLSEVKTAMIRNITERAGRLARITGVKLPSSKPSVALAYDLYGDAERADELVARNEMSDPMFSPTGKALEVLER